MTQPAAPNSPFIVTPATRKSEEEPTNIKETIDSILVAFILAFVFRAFIVEAFVIPTGSMAPTLLGAHMRFDCADCGYEFTVNYSGEQQGDDVIVPSHNKVLVREQSLNGATRIAEKDRVLHLICPNCGFKLPREDPTDKSNDATGPPVFYGDRILVLKYLYLFKEADRWDVVVFKSPTDPKYQLNFIKRLIGLPGESILILDGDVYVARKPTDGQQLFAADFVVQTKPRHVQEALWRIVHDNDFQPVGKPRVAQRAYDQPWRIVNGQGWTLEAGGGPPEVAKRVFRFDNASSSGTIAFDPIANKQKFPLTDWLAYDMTMSQDPHLVDTYTMGLTSARANVSDLKLDLHYERLAGDGPLRLRMTKLGDAFVAEVHPDKVVLMQASTSSTPSVIGTYEKKGVGSGLRHIVFQNVDYQVSLFIDGQEVIRTADYRPNVPALLEGFASGRPQALPEISVSAERQTGTLSHISLWRDVYYLNSQENGAPQRWATPYQFPSRVIHLSGDEYFVCGDNSLASHDARAWSSQIELPDEQIFAEAGRVPRRFMLGKAFFVYWPAGYRPTDGAPGLVPNFGDMRFIH